MSSSELTLQIDYTKEKFNLVYTLHSLSTFATLAGGLDRDIIAPIVPNWSQQVDQVLVASDALAQVQARLDKSLDLRVHFYFPQSEELISLLAKAYKTSEAEVKTYTTPNKVLLGYGNINIWREGEKVYLIILPDLANLSQAIMNSSTVRSYLVDFCHSTGAVKACWEDDCDEAIIQQIWPNIAKESSDRTILLEPRLLQEVGVLSSGRSTGEDYSDW
ncbi:MAG: hypothetical protein F6K47_27640 [Symploca sp. SIO2E6]|nr:hypothetical protein [Symploca sp. SIO2E6]